MNLYQLLSQVGMQDRGMRQSTGGDILANGLPMNFNQWGGARQRNFLTGGDPRAANWGFTGTPNTGFGYSAPKRVPGSAYPQPTVAPYVPPDPNY